MEGGRERGREGEKEGGREGEKKGGREGGREEDIGSRKVSPGSMRSSTDGPARRSADRSLHAEAAQSIANIADAATDAMLAIGELYRIHTLWVALALLAGEPSAFSPPYCRRCCLGRRDALMYATLAPMAKLDKAPAYEAGDCRFESCSERQFRGCARLWCRAPSPPRPSERWPSG